MKAVTLGLLAVFSTQAVAQVSQDSVNTLLSSAYSCALPATLKVEADEQTIYQSIADKVHTTLTDAEAAYNLPGLTKKLATLMADQTQVSNDAPAALNGIKQAVAKKDLTFSADYVSSLCTKLLRNASNSLELEDAAANKRMPVLKVIPSVRPAQPKYPKHAADSGISGQGTYLISVNEQGNVTDCTRTESSQIQDSPRRKPKSSNTSTWDKASCAAINAAKYAPVVFNGAPIAFNTEYQMQFAVVGSSKRR